MEIIAKIKRNKLEMVLFLVIVAIGIFFRSHHFSDWLHFEIDQTFDINAVAPAVEGGIGELPLLGPVVAGGPLRLGPSFYYFEYIGAKIFGNTPPGHAASVLIFSFASLFVFYFFCRRYFSTHVSLGLLALFSSSLYLVLYSRFSWNPNILPFFLLFTFYALLRSISIEEKRRDFWFLIMSFFAGVATQLHFNAFLIIPPIIVSFLIIKRPHFRMRIWLFAGLIILAVYLPVIANDVWGSGKNFEYLAEKFIGNSENDKDNKKKSISEKSFQVMRYNIYEYFLILTGSDQVNSSRPKGYSLGLSCNSCKENIPVRLTAIVFFAISISILIKSVLTEKDKNRTDFLQIVILWLFFSSLYFIAITYKGLYIYPRFFLIVAPVPFIFFGLIAEEIMRYRYKIGLAIFLSFISVIAFFNIEKILQNFHQLEMTSLEAAKIETEDIFPNNARITLEHQDKIMDYIKSRYAANGYPIYIKSESEYEPSFWYHFEKAGIHEYASLKDGSIYKEGNYFLIIKAQNSKISFSDYEENFALAEQTYFGTLIVQTIVPLNEKITETRQDFSGIKRNFQPTKSPNLVRWNDLF